MKLESLYFSTGAPGVASRIILLIIAVTMLLVVLLSDVRTTSKFRRHITREG